MRPRSAPADDPKPSDLLIREQFDLTLRESADDGGSVFNDDGTINVVILRPCNGRGLGNRLYEADVLERDAGVFAGWSMFDNHDAPAAKRARGGLPRGPKELAGVLVETWWDPEFTTPDDEKLGHDKGAVVGRARLAPDMRALVEAIPEAIKLSINAQATGIKPARRDGRAGWLVEGILDDAENSSVDFVTKAGAGGRVAALLESLADDPPGADRPAAPPAGDVADMTLIEAFDLASDEEFTDYLTSSRPHLLTTNPEEGEMGLEQLQEALRSDEGRALVDDIIRARVAEELPTLRESIREEVRGELADSAKWTRLEREARKLIEAARLPDTATANLLADYATADGPNESIVPVGKLALVEAQLDADGKPVRTAEEVLAGLIDADVRARRAELREAAPTVPWSAAGASALQESASGGDGGSASAAVARARQVSKQLAGIGVTTPTGS